MKSLAPRLATIFLIAGIGALASSLQAQELIPKPPEKPLLLVDIKNALFIPSGKTNVFSARNNLFLPAGTPNMQTQIMDPQLVDKDVQVLSVVLQNRTSAPLENLKVEYAMYKLDKTGALKRMSKGIHIVPCPPRETTVFVGQGALETGKKRLATLPTRTGTNERKDEEFYGWYVKIFYAGQQIYEKFDPPLLKNSEIVKQK